METTTAKKKKGKILSPQTRYRTSDRWATGGQVLAREVPETEAQREARIAYWKQVAEPKKEVGPLAVTFTEALNIFEERIGKKWPRFKRDKQSERVFKLLTAYILKDPIFEKQVDTFGRNYSLDKGIYLHGPLGTGKSTIMEIFGLVNARQWKCVNCIDLSRAYENENGGTTVIDPYFTDKVFCFDDLGREKNPAVNYGRPYDIMQGILNKRYEMWRTEGIVTHVTTNITDRSKLIYGDYIISRCKEMFNDIYLNGEDRRK